MYIPRPHLTSCAGTPGEALLAAIKAIVGLYLADPKDRMWRAQYEKLCHAEATMSDI